jgi:hypothetical protein
MNDYVPVIALNESKAKIKFKMYRERLKFIPMDYYFIQTLDDEMVFSHAIAKFQDLVNYE